MLRFIAGSLVVLCLQSAPLAFADVPLVPDAREVEPDTVCAIPVSAQAERASADCLNRLSSSQLNVAEAPDQEALLAAMDSILKGEWPASEPACREVLKRAEGVSVLRPLSSSDIAEAVCKADNVACVEVDRAGFVKSGCGKSAQGLKIHLSELPELDSSKPQHSPSATTSYGRLYRISEMYSWGGTAFDLSSTVRGINHGLHEVGIYRVVGDQNRWGIVAMAAAMEGILTLSSRLIYRNGRTKTATFLNFLRGSVHVAAGVHNERLIRQVRR